MPVEILFVADSFAPDLTIFNTKPHFPSYLLMRGLSSLMENRDEIVTFHLGDMAMEISISPLARTAWLTKKQIQELYGTSKQVVLYHLKSILKGGPLEGSLGKTCTMLGQNGKKYHTKVYSLEAVLEVGRRLHSNDGKTLKRFVEDYLRGNNENEDNKVIQYENGNISLPVTISPKENTVWLSQRQITVLFEASQQRISFHIKNIYQEGELTREDTNRRFLTSAENGKKYKVDYYNLDMILAVGYRVKGPRAIEFRRWASSVLSKYLLKGYAIDESRTLVTDENFAHLFNRVEDLSARVTKLEEHEAKPNLLLFDGNFFEARVLLKSIFSQAKNSITLIDPYADILALDFLTQKSEGIKVELYVSSHARLTEEDAKAFNQKFGGLEVHIDDAFHDRFIILDETLLYHMGASLNYAGRKTFAINRIEDREYIASLLMRLKEK